MNNNTDTVDCEVVTEKGNNVEILAAFKNYNSAGGVEMGRSPISPNSHPISTRSREGSNGSNDPQVEAGNDRQKSVADVKEDSTVCVVKVEIETEGETLNDDDSHRSLLPWDFPHSLTTPSGEISVCDDLHSSSSLPGAVSPSLTSPSMEKSVNNNGQQKSKVCVSTMISKALKWHIKRKKVLEKMCKQYTTINELWTKPVSEKLAHAECLLALKKLRLKLREIRRIENAQKQREENRLQLERQKIRLGKLRNEREERRIKNELKRKTPEHNTEQTAPETDMQREKRIARLELAKVVYERKRRIKEERKLLLRELVRSRVRQRLEESASQRIEQSTSQRQEQSTSQRQEQSPSHSSESEQGENEPSTPVKPRCKLKSTSPTEHCWECHKTGTTVTCIKCPRVYHKDCSQVLKNSLRASVCSECRKLDLVKNSYLRKTRSITDEKLNDLLRYSLGQIKQAMPDDHYQYLEQQVGRMDKLNSYPMNFNILEKKIKATEYTCTWTFLSDVKWILHNSIVMSGVASKMTIVARDIVKDCENEMNEIGRCPDCYLHMNTTKEWFIEACKPPHILVWAKAATYPYWPAKVIQKNKEEVEVRFFGHHDLAVVPVANCFRLSNTSPTSLCSRWKSRFDEIIKEVNQHIESLPIFKMAAHRTPLGHSSTGYVYNVSDGSWGRPIKANKIKTTGNTVEVIYHTDRRARKRKRKVLTRDHQAKRKDVGSRKIERKCDHQTQRKDVDSPSIEPPDDHQTKPMDAIFSYHEFEKGLDGPELDNPDEEPSQEHAQNQGVKESSQQHTQNQGVKESDKLSLNHQKDSSKLSLNNPNEESTQQHTQNQGVSSQLNTQIDQDSSSRNHQRKLNSQQPPANRPKSKHDFFLYNVAPFLNPAEIKITPDTRRVEPSKLAASRSSYIETTPGFEHNSSAARITTATKPSSLTVTNPVAVATTKLVTQTQPLPNLLKSSKEPSEPRSTDPDEIYFEHKLPDSQCATLVTKGLKPSTKPSSHFITTPVAVATKSSAIAQTQLFTKVLKSSTKPSESRNSDPVKRYLELLHSKSRTTTPLKTRVEFSSAPHIKIPGEQQTIPVTRNPSEVIFNRPIPIPNKNSTTKQTTPVASGFGHSAKVRVLGTTLGTCSNQDKIPSYDESTLEIIRLVSGDYISKESSLDQHSDKVFVLNVSKDSINRVNLVGANQLTQPTANQLGCSNSPASIHLPLQFKGCKSSRTFESRVNHIQNRNSNCQNSDVMNKNVVSANKLGGSNSPACINLPRQDKTSLESRVNHIQNRNSNYRNSGVLNKNCKANLAVKKISRKETTVLKINKVQTELKKELDSDNERLDEIARMDGNCDQDDELVNIIKVELSENNQEVLMENSNNQERIADKECGVVIKVEHEENLVNMNSMNECLINNEVSGEVNTEMSEGNEVKGIEWGVMEEL